MALVEGPMGLPPTDNRGLGLNGNGPNMFDLTRDAMPILEMQPCFPKFSAGLKLYTLQRGYYSPDPHTQFSYKDELEAYYNVTLQDGGKLSAVDSEYLQFAYLNINPPVESFTNDYEESMFSGLADVGSQGLRQLAFATNTRDLGEATKNLQNQMTKMFGDKFAQGQFNTLLDKTQNFLSGGNKIGSLLNQASRGATGRIDFPQFWRSSGWDPSYNVSIRLYNPFPQNAEATEKYITGPLAALMMFVVPRSQDSYTFHWPWLCKFRVKGLFDIQAGYVKNIQVVKGGDDNSIGFNQRVGIVDVKMDLGVLYRSMVSGQEVTGSDRPQLSNWLNQFREAKTITETASPTPTYVAFEENVSTSAENRDQFKQTQKPSINYTLIDKGKLFESSATDRGLNTETQSRREQANSTRTSTDVSGLKPT